MTFKECTLLIIQPSHSKCCDKNCTVFRPTSAFVWSRSYYQHWGRQWFPLLHGHSGCSSCRNIYRGGVGCPDSCWLLSSQT